MENVQWLDMVTASERSCGEQPVKGPQRAVKSLF